MSSLSTRNNQPNCPGPDDFKRQCQAFQHRLMGMPSLKHQFTGLDTIVKALDDTWYRIVPPKSDQYHCYRHDRHAILFSDLHIDLQ